MIDLVCDLSRARINTEQNRSRFINFSCPILSPHYGSKSATKKSEEWQAAIKNDFNFLIISKHLKNYVFLIAKWMSHCWSEFLTPKKNIFYFRLALKHAWKWNKIMKIFYHVTSREVFLGHRKFLSHSYRKRIRYLITAWWCKERRKIKGIKIQFFFIINVKA